MRSTFWRTLVRMAAVLLLATPGTLHAHEGGVLKVATRSVGAGDSLAVTGEKLSKNSAVKLTLIGVDGRRVLLDIRADAKGGFAANVLIPSDVGVGAYRLVAVAADGDEISGVDLMITGMPTQGHEGMSHDAEDGMAMPSAEPLALVRARSGWVSGGAATLALASLALSIFLLKRPRQAG